MYRPSVWLRLALVGLLALGLVFAFVNRAAIDPHIISDHIDDYVLLMPAAFFVAHVAASLLFVPRTVMAVVAGMLFGLWWGSLWSLIGATAGAAAGFLLARYINSDLVVVEEVPRLGPLLIHAEAGGWRAVMAARLLPILPHALVNYGLGLTRLSFRAYLVGSVAGILPTTIVYVNLGASGRTALSGAGWLEPMLWGLALLGASLIVPRLFLRRSR